MFGPVFRGVRALMYNSPEERAMIQAAAGNAAVPGVVVGVGSDVPERTDPDRFRRKFKMRRPFAIYIGRIDENKGCGELFAHFQRYAAAFPRGMDLVLVGSAVMDVPKHPRIHHLGFLADADKFDALSASDLLIMPSYYESLSMVALEAWALGKPVLANGRCDVLRGQCMRSNAGLYYETYEEFVEALYSLESNGPLNARLGRNGRDFFRQHYAWPVIERKYLDMFAQLKRELPPEGGSHAGSSNAGSSDAGRRDAAGRHSSQPVASAFRRKEIEPLPGWFARRKRNLPPARDVLQQIPDGPAVDASDAGRKSA
jgi:glycosyltransferase involved in cell wall biosynthesis